VNLHGGGLERLTDDFALERKVTSQRKKIRPGCPLSIAQFVVVNEDGLIERSAWKERQI